MIDDQVSTRPYRLRRTPGQTAHATMHLRIGLLERTTTREHVGTSMSSIRERLLAFWSFPVLIFLGGCDAKVECDSPETREAVLNIVSNDHSNALATYAAKNSNVAKDLERPAIRKAQNHFIVSEKRSLRRQRVRISGRSRAVARYPWSSATQKLPKK